MKQDRRWCSEVGDAWEEETREAENNLVDNCDLRKDNSKANVGQTCCAGSEQVEAERQLCFCVTQGAKKD